MNNNPGVRYQTKCGWFGTLPVVRHGTVTFAQSGAVQKYFPGLSQKWKLLTPQQVAVDDMFAALFEALFVALFKVEDDATAIPTVMDKYMAALEQLVPPDSSMAKAFQPQRTLCCSLYLKLLCRRGSS